MCGWRAGMYSWNAGGEPSDRFGLWLVGGVREHVVCDITTTQRLSRASCLLQRWSFLPAKLTGAECGLTHLATNI